jgi:drug/metabolite transporter (DMT)-like permease
VRESSVIIATIIGLVFFGERPWRGRLIASIVVVGGIIALAFGT